MRREGAVSKTTAVQRSCQLHPVINKAHMLKNIISARTIAMENPVMDGNLWSRLPEDVIERVFSWLPITSVVRLRTVCKRWAKLVATKSFVEAFTGQVASSKPYFVKISKSKFSRSLMTFDPSINRWCNTSLSYLPSEVGLPVSASGGLICFGHMNQQEDHRDGARISMFFVSNPLTKTWKELPQCPYGRWTPLVRMIMWKRPSHYKVIVADIMKTNVFDSVEGKWSITSGRECSRNAAFCNGSLYCLTWSPLDNSSVLLGFNIQDEVWSKVKTGRLPGLREFRKLVTCNGHLAIVSKARRDQVMCVCVWLLDIDTMEWREKGRMPQLMYHEFHRLNSADSFSCCSHNALIFLTMERCDNSLLFDLAQNEWRWTMGGRNLNGFFFEPRLDSQV